MFMLQSSALKETELQSSAFLRTDIGLQSWTWISFLSYDIIAHLPIVEVFCQQPLFPLSFFFTAAV